MSVAGEPVKFGDNQRCPARAVGGERCSKLGLVGTLAALHLNKLGQQLPRPAVVPKDIECQLVFYTKSL